MSASCVGWRYGICCYNIWFNHQVGSSTVVVARGGDGSIGIVGGGGGARVDERQMLLREHAGGTSAGPRMMHADDAT